MSECETLKCCDKKLCSMHSTIIEGMHRIKAPSDFRYIRSNSSFVSQVNTRQFGRRI